METERPNTKERSKILKDFTDTTSRVVQQAASILEEEVSAGIRVAKQVEERFLKVDELRSGKPEDVVQRFRRDAHDLVDILVDLAQAAAKSVGDFAQRAISIRTGERLAQGSPAASGQVPTLAMPQPLRPGQSGEVPMTVENDGDAPTAEFTFHSTDFLNPSGGRIPAQQVAFAPASMVIAPHSTGKVMITVSVPEGTPPGVYSGLLLARRLEQLRALLMVQVE